MYAGTKHPAGVINKADRDRPPTVPTPLSAAKLQEHPEFPHVTWELIPTKKGKIAAAKDRGGPINIAYEVHGNGPKHIVVSLHKCFFYIHIRQLPHVVNFGKALFDQ